jgi:hypothetical protein
MLEQVTVKHLFKLIASHSSFYHPPPRPFPHHHHQDVQTRKGPEPTDEEVDDDLNGINPLQSLGSAAFAGLVSFLFWRITVGLALTLNRVHLDTDFYPAQRLFSVASTAFVGIMALGAGVIGVTALGLLGLTVRVALGVASGELDPNKKAPEKPKSTVPLDAQGLPKVTGAWYDVKTTNVIQSAAEAPKEEGKGE